MLKKKLMYLLAFCLLITLSVNGNTEEVQTTKFTVQSKMSTLWIAVTANWIFADVLGLYGETNAEHEEFAQKKNIEELMLLGALTIQVPISMIFLSRVLPYKVNRWANMIAPALCAGFIIVGRSEVPSYIACASFECIWLTAITVYALKWRNPEVAQKWEKKNNISFNFDYDKKVCNLKYTYKLGRM